MSLFSISNEKLNSLAAVLFLIGLGILVYFDYSDLWGGLMLAVGVAIAVRQFLETRFLDVVMAIIVFGGCWFVNYYNTNPRLYVPILLSLGALYLIGTQIYYYAKNRSGAKRKGG